VQSRSVTTDVLAGFMPARASLALALAAAACLLLCGCSPGADYPSLFPSVREVPPRTETTLDPVQVQQATEDLISQRNHLSAEAQGPGQKDSGQKDSANPSANAANPQAAKTQAATSRPTAGNGQAAAATGTLTAETK